MWLDVSVNDSFVMGPGQHSYLRDTWGWASSILAGTFQLTIRLAIKHADLRDIGPSALMRWERPCVNSSMQIKPYRDGPGMHRPYINGMPAPGPSHSYISVSLSSRPQAQTSSQPDVTSCGPPLSRLPLHSARQIANLPGIEHAPLYVSRSIKNLGSICAIGRF